MLGWYHRQAHVEGADLLNPIHIDDIADDCGRKIFNNFWGSYIAILHSNVNPEIVILRDPSGGMPCYYAYIDDVIELSSHMDILEARKSIKYIIDDDEIGHHLLFPALRTSRTCLAGLREVPAGFQLRIDQRTVTLSQIWDPWTYARRNAYHDDPHEAVSDLRTAICTTMQAWVARFEKPVIGLSGGLDSSIVAASAVSAGAKATGLTLVTDESAGDERYYAREIANFLGIPLEERYFSAAETDLQESHAAHLPRPVARSFAQSGDMAYCDVAAKAGADAFFTGSGGDSVFCFQQSILPIADRLLYDGVGRGACRTTAEIAEMAETSVLRCAVLAMRRAWFRNPSYRWKPETTLLHSDFLYQHSKVASHPWLEVPVGELPGKAAHIVYLLQIQNHLEGFRRENVLPIIDPLMSQPIVEVCLRIPTWFSCANGENRSIARQAFAPYLPDSILHRKTKGGPDGFLQRLFYLNRNRIRDMLLGGYLAAAHLIDAGAVESAIMRNGRDDHHLQFRLLELVDVEAWISAIKSR
ncbi:asparagine synthase-related protein [Sphingomonas sp. IW22]|uniref:asparagine synthase-related protein n=1 Tax=Sphingomonas sp. IW22 TaxID=3242489 RepID=UPI00351FAD7A